MRSKITVLHILERYGDLAIRGCVIPPLIRLSFEAVGSCRGVLVGCTAIRFTVGQCSFVGVVTTRI
jgi:hypothetical protein